MMEVKHSPATQMEFRSSRNGLSETVEDEMETLFEEESTKPVIPKADKCDEKLPILNGVSKCLEKSDPIKNLDDIDIDLDLQKDEHDETAAEKEDSEVYDLDLEPESAGDTQNGEVTDSSKVRDTGDDLDTLLSKINDLVEDCMDKPKVSVPKTNAEDVVEIADDDLDDVAKDEVESELKNSGEGEEESEILEDSEVSAKKEGSSEKEDSVKESKESTSDKMDVDDFVFCLDSPLDESRSQGEEIPEAEEVLETAEEEVKIQKKEKTSVSTAPADKETVQSKPSEEEDDDVFLIEDDEDEQAVMETESTGIEDEELNKAIAEIQSESKKKFEEEAENVCNEVAEDKSEDGTKLEGDASVTVNEEDDDIVCLDDSNEAIEKKEDEPTEDTSVSKKVDASAESKTEEAEQEVEKPSESVEETVTEEAEKETVEEESATKPVEMEVEEEQPLENASDSDDTPAPVSGCAKFVKEAEEEKADPNTEKSSAVAEDDDVVILDDDDEQSEVIPPVTSTTPDQPVDQPSTSDSCGALDEAKASEEEKAAEEEATSDKGSIVESSAIMPDNSDNARDGVDEKDDNDEAKQTAKETSVSAESDSCSASDSLLKESKKGIRTEAEENNEQPPTKKLRLSQDESNSRISIISHEESKSNTPDNDNDEAMDDNKSLKRVRSTESISADFKKPKTETELDKVDDNNSKDSKDITESKDDVCKPEIKHLPLYPPPKLEPPTIDLSLDFLKRFKKTIHKMTKSDLEELVLQKIVEAIVHKSEFSEMRELIEKQDKIIAGHRTKITELNKQFRDLEMVHNRVLKDLETKNAQFVMPVKITRAVGLQVFFPAKKFDPTLMPLAPQNTTPVPPPHNPRNLLNNSGHSSDRPSHSSPVAASSNTPKSSTSTSSQAASSSSVQQQAPPQRRGCVQKLTPLRPDTPRNSPLNRSISAGVVSSSTPSPSTSKEFSSKFAPRPVGPKTRVTPVSVVGNMTSKVQVTMSPNDPALPEQPKKYKPITMNLHKPTTKVTAKRHPQHGNSDPQTVAQTLPAAALIVAPAIPPTVVPTGASKSGQKSVIDLTDEDDVIPPAPAPSSKVPVAPAAQAPTTPQPSAASSGSRPYKVSVVPQQQLQQTKPSAPKQVQQRPIAPAPSKPNGVVSRQLCTPQSRYRHPAPLPNQPIHSNNPAWKLPPARPTIRISNLESGIVISWTIEDTTKDKYAESTSYQIYAYQETSGPPLVESWRHVGDVKAMLLPMAVTLTQFQEGQRYYFAVRAVDAHNRCGPFSFAKTWS